MTIQWIAKSNSTYSILREAKRPMASKRAPVKISKFSFFYKSLQCFIWKIRDIYSDEIGESRIARQ